MFVFVQCVSVCGGFYYHVYIYHSFYEHLFYVEQFEVSFYRKSALSIVEFESSIEVPLYRVWGTLVI